MLQQPEPGDYVVATGRQYSVRDCVTLAGNRLGMRIEFRGQGLEEQGIDAKTGRVVVRVDSRYFRPAEVETLLGDATKARTVLGWEPKVSFEQLVAEMVDSDLELARRDAAMTQQGFKVANSHE